MEASDCDNEGAEGGRGTRDGSFSLTLALPNNLINPLFLCFKFLLVMTGALASLTADTSRPVANPLSDPLLSGCLTKEDNTFLALVPALIDRPRARAATDSE